MDARALENESPNTAGVGRGGSFRFLSPSGQGWTATLEFESRSELMWQTESSKPTASLPSHPRGRTPPGSRLPWGKEN